MKYLVRGVLTIFLTTLSFSGFAQSQVKSKVVKVMNHNDNVKQPLTSQEMDFLVEAYGDELDEYILNRPQRLKDVKDILRNRVKIELASRNEKSAYLPLLSTVALFTTYNSALKRDVNFDKNTFNPLKYQFHFHGFGTSMYRVDNTNYIVIIKPQQR
jgi:hypothetical protein